MLEVGFPTLHRPQPAAGSRSGLLDPRDELITKRKKVSLLFINE